MERLRAHRFQALGLRDYARIDFASPRNRLHDRGQSNPYCTRAPSSSARRAPQDATTRTITEIVEPRGRGRRPRLEVTTTCGPASVS